MYPRAKALGLIIYEDNLLLEEYEGIHSKGTGYYYRPIGGTIEYGERSEETILREYNEELGAGIIIKRYITCLENIFKIDDDIGHELFQIYLVEFIDKSLYQYSYLSVKEGNRKSYAKWVPIKMLCSGKKILYPNGLVEILKKVT
ncbi:NUDIX hydrolase [Pseudalkalibacillus sp. R45]|uniref:NUDIX hydrolase n=1 Tax=Pseudalkalibacillus sp. R45 TaxID=3457433 RepID=UPI003FCD8419